jgi:hypothetical protein
MGWLSEMIQDDMRAQMRMQEIFRLVERNVRLMARRAEAKKRGYRPSRPA